MLEERDGWMWDGEYKLYQVPAPEDPSWLCVEEELTRLAAYGQWCEFPDFLRHSGAYCKVCGEQTHAIRRARPLDARELPGWPLAQGRANPDVVRVNVLLSDGSYAPMSLHKWCVPPDAQALANLWWRVLDSAAFHGANQWAIRGVDRPAGPKADEAEAGVLADARRIAGLVPLEVVVMVREEA